MPDPPGVSIAFQDNWNVDAPTWTRLDTLDGCRVRGWTVDRGRPSEFEKTGTGTATIQLVDRAGLFDPTAAAPVYLAAPALQVAISLRNPVNGTWHLVFRGFVEQWRYQLDRTRQYMAVELSCADGFSILSRAQLQPGRDGALPPFDEFSEDVAADLANLAAGNVLYGYTEGTLRDRLEAILGDVEWPPEWMVQDIDLFTGNVRAAPKAYGPGTSALDALWDAVDAEFPGVGNLFCAANGHLWFRGRQARFRPDVAEYGIQRWTAADPSFTTGHADRVPIAELEWTLGNDNLFNVALATPEKVSAVGSFRPLNPTKDDVAGQLVTADDVGDTASIPVYGRQSLTFDNLQTGLDIATGEGPMAAVKKVATYYVQNYKDPHPRISRLTFKTRRPDTILGPILWQFLCNVEISDLITVQSEHPGGGGFNTDFYVEGIHYTCRPGNADHPVVELSLDVSPRAHWTTNPFDEDPYP